MRFTIATLVLACAFWSFDMLCLWCTFQAFGYTIGLGHLLVAFVVAYSIGTLAPTPGGLGAVEEERGNVAAVPGPDPRLSR